MSLFEDDPQSRSKSALFDDEPTPAAQKTSSSLFADDLNDSADSPWAFPTPKKTARGTLVKTLLPATDVPESYIDCFDSLLASDRVGNGISISGVKGVLAESKISPDAQEKILHTINPSGQEPAQGVGRGEFNVLLALIGLAQEGEDVTLDGVDERRRNLPIPSLGNLKPTRPSRPEEISQASEGAQAAPPSSVNQAQPAPSAPPRTRNTRKQSFGDPESDPWASPDMHKGHNHPPSNGAAGRVNGASTSTVPSRTTSTFTTTASQHPGSTPPADPGAIHQSAESEGAGWGGYTGASNDGFIGHNTGGEGFEGSTGGSGGASGIVRPVGGGRTTNSGVEEVVSVTSISEKEGMFLFQHHNYQVASTRRNSKVIRRYSDFVWLLDCLHKRYPFRQLPLLPPKRVAINGNYIAADSTFVEKRRRGLARFVNALVRHPVLNQEQLVTMFLEVPTELAVWRKQATISVQEEFVGKTLPSTLEDSLPANLQDMFDTVRSGVRRSAEIYINLCNLIERLAKRNEGIAAEQLRISLALQSLAEVSADTYAVDTNDVPLLNEGIRATAKHLTTDQSLLEDEARGWDEGVLEDLKRQRDCLVSVRDMFDRRDRYDRDNIPQLERRIQSNENKLAGIRSRPEHQQKPGEAERVEDAILRDKQSIVNQHARGVFIKECIRDELVYFQQSQYHVSKLHQDWSQERVKYAELQADNWRALCEELENMPTGG